MENQSVLLVGPSYINHKGGIGSMIAEFKKLMPSLKTHATYFGGKGSMFNLLFFPIQLGVLFFRLCSPKIRIVHIHSSFKGSFFRKFLVFKLAKIMRKKTIFHIHSGGFMDYYNGANAFTQRKVRKVFETADKVVCLTDSWFDKFKAAFGDKNLVVIPNFVNFDASEVKRATSCTRTIFLFLGKLSRAKGVYDLLAVAKELSKVTQNFEVWIGGNGEIREVEEFILHSKMESNVKVLGWIDAGRKLDILSQASVMILPSYFEGLPVSILEAMSFGIPILSTNVGGIPDVISDGVEGLLIEPGNIEKLKAKMLLLIDNPHMVDEMGMKAKQRFNSSFSPVSVRTKLEATYSDVLKS
jgi:glycosyltransferase involved in cell wall biosynthesis